MSNHNCTDCWHLQPRRVCGFERSPLFGKTVSSGDCCEFLVVNPSMQHFIEGLKISLEAGSDAAAIPHYEAALNGQLPRDDEVAVRFALAQGYTEVVGNSGLSWHEMVARPEFSKAIGEAEKSVDI